MVAQSETKSDWKPAPKDKVMPCPKCEKGYPTVQAFYEPHEEGDRIVNCCTACGIQGYLKSSDEIVNAFSAEIMAVEMVIENEIKRKCTQRQIAMTYALALRSSYPTDWKKVNDMIIERWSVAGLIRIKELAWSGKCFIMPKSK